MTIVFKKISFGYNENKVLENISTEIEDGDFAALIGPNGSGKTTMVKLILGFLKPTSGEIKVFGKTPQEIQQSGKIGYVPQSFSIDKNFPGSVGEIIGSDKEGQKDLKMLGIQNLIFKKFVDLSGGQKQRVMIALALKTKPQLLILDEPTVGVDTKAQKDFYELLKKINYERKTTILIVTHDISVISKYVKKVICLNGKICCTGKASEAGKLLKKAYGSEFEMFEHGHSHD